jgi:hypothetical protein
MLIAIQPDDYTAPGRPPGEDASSPRWAHALKAAGHEIRWVDVYRADILEQLRDCQGFMWRWGHCGGMFQIAHRLLPVLERQLGLAVYPDQNTCWHYDDKAAQALLLEAAGIPVPKTWVWYHRQAAIDWARLANYPVVLKLAGGAGSTNVRLVRSFEEAAQWIQVMFESGAERLDQPGHPPPLAWKRRLKYAWRLVRGKPLPEAPVAWPLHKNYILFQEFLPGNTFDTRVSIIGNRAFCARRLNRENDFRASGSGLARADWDPSQILPEFVRLGFETARRLNMQSCAIDGLMRGKVPVVGEVSYTSPSHVMYNSPGQWDKDLNWHPGHMWPEEAQVADFCVRLEACVREET